jgi:hypothetical protein
MKSMIVASILLVGLAASADDLCKKGDIKDCAKVLKTKEGADDFVVQYDQVCRDNKTFKCLKRTVRGDVKEELKYIKEEFPKAYFFSTKDSGEDKVFVLDKK